MSERYFFDKKRQIENAKMSERHSLQSDDSLSTRSSRVHQNQPHHPQHPPPQRPRGATTGAGGGGNRGGGPAGRHRTVVRHSIAYTKVETVLLGVLFNVPIVLPENVCLNCLNSTPQNLEHLKSFWFGSSNVIQRWITPVDYSTR